MSLLKTLRTTLVTPSPHLYKDRLPRERNTSTRAVTVINVLSAIQQNEAFSIHVAHVNSSVT